MSTPEKRSYRGTRRIAYIATIRREGNEYVARDENGSKRAWGAVKDCSDSSASKLAASLFHAEEIGNVSWLGGGACVEILDFSKPKPIETHTITESTMQAQLEQLVEVIDEIDNLRSDECYRNPLLAHCLERVLTDLRKAANELATLATLTKGGE